MSKRNSLLRHFGKELSVSSYSREPIYIEKLILGQKPQKRIKYWSMHHLNSIFFIGFENQSLQKWYLTRYYKAGYPDHIFFMRFLHSDIFFFLLSFPSVLWIRHCYMGLLLYCCRICKENHHGHEVPKGDKVSRYCCMCNIDFKDSTKGDFRQLHKTPCIWVGLITWLFGKSSLARITKKQLSIETSITQMKYFRSALQCFMCYDYL